MSDDDWSKSPDCSIDPFPDDVAPSLLNSADIIRYAERGCLVQPFSRDPGYLNPATYTISFLGTLYYWKDEGQTRFLCPKPIEKGQRTTLEANSISYLETAEQFRLPQYIAARFNLHIRHVHKGILLGTGPIVDPGFSGRLLIPLHNLTANNYALIGGDRFLWVEFTKLTHHPYWTRPTDKLSERPPSDLVVFPDDKRALTAQQYFQKAEISTSGVISAFKGALEDSRSQAQASRLASEAARRDALAAANRSEKLTFWGALGIATGIAALVLSAWQLFQNNSEMASGIHERLDRMERGAGLLPPACGAPVTTPVGTMVGCQETGTGNQPTSQDSDPEPGVNPDDDAPAEDRTAHAQSEPSAR